VYFLLELPCQLDIPQVHLVLLGDVLVQVLVICLEIVQGVVVELVLVLLVTHPQAVIYLYYI
jgi:hypothetical protein